MLCLVGNDIMPMVDSTLLQPKLSVHHYPKITKWITDDTWVNTCATSTLEDEIGPKPSPAFVDTFWRISHQSLPTTTTTTSTSTSTTTNHRPFGAVFLCLNALHPSSWNRNLEAFRQRGNARNGRCKCPR